MSRELELANQKIKELEARVLALKYEHRSLMVLPNGDLHRGLRMEDANQPNIDVERIESHNPLNKAVAQILTAAKGGHALTCLWCGLQWDGAGAEKEVRAHLKKDHPTVVEGYDSVTSEVLFANLEEAKARLREATAR